MCGIYGHIKTKGKRNSVTICIDGLKKLEYRGYDSAGIAGIAEGKLVSYKTVGKVALLDATVRKHNVQLEMAIAHTRWATHGERTEINAHPHFDETHSIALVHNGIIENYQTLKHKLEEKGIVFRSETDSEVISQLIAYHYDGDIFKAVQATLPHLEGSFAIALIHKDHPSTIVTATRNCPLIIGICPKTKDLFLSSDAGAFCESTLDIFHLSDDECAVITQENIDVYNRAGNILTKSRERLGKDILPATKEGFEHFLLKEIFDQPKSIESALKNRIDIKNATAYFEELHLTDETLRDTSHVLILACGSSYHAGCIARLLFESYAKIPTTVEIASEFRYFDPIIPKNTLVIAISQSGETADTLAAVKEAKSKGHDVIALCNVKHSTLPRIATSTLWLNAGPEISVCSTKAFTSQLTLLMLLALKIARLKGYPEEKGRQFLFHIGNLQGAISSVLSKAKEIEAFAIKYAKYHEYIFIGRKHMYATSLESALKLKEITYRNATGYPAGELKHGPIALISSEVPTIALCGNEHTFDKLISNLMEIKARGGPILAFAPIGHTEITAVTPDVIFLPSNLPDEFTPIVYSTAGQLFAYYTARTLGTDIDQPRNLAKSVTVE